METQIDLDTYGNLPRHVRQSLATETQQPSATKQPSATANEANDNAEQNEVDNPFTSEQSSHDVIEQTQVDERNNALLNTPETPTTTPEDNEAKTWKGRLSKEQAEHKATFCKCF